MGDQDRGARLERLRSQLTAQARGKLRDDCEVEELVQETLVRCFAQPPKSRRSLPAYARAVLANLISRRWRDGELTVPNEELDGREEAGPHSPCKQLVCADRSRGRDELAEEELAEFLHRQTRKLPRDLRCVCEPHWFDGVPYRDIARRLGIDETTARVRCHKARRCLQCDPSVLAALGMAACPLLVNGRRATRGGARAGGAAPAARRSG